MTSHTTNDSNIVISETTAHDIMTRGMALCLEHYDEVPFGTFDVPLNPCLDQYEAMEAANALRCIAAYDGANMVGYVTVFAAEMLRHKGNYQITTDSFYVDPAYRRSGLFAKMMDKLEQLARENDIRFVSYAVNPVFHDSIEIEMWLASKGFQVTETIYTKEVK